MTFLHISDLHLGKRVLEQPMLAEQRHALLQIAEWARGVDATIIAGDVYDRQVPPAEAVALFDEFLTRMSAQGSPVLLIAGNHDSAERIAFGARLMDRSGVYVAPVYDGHARCVTLRDAHGEVDVWLMPFIKPAHVRAALDRPDLEGYTAAMAAAIGKMALRPGVRSVLVAHQFVTGAARSESEEISVGGLDNVDAEAFAPFCYVALGHLHAPQSLAGGRVRYSGSPLCYAFSECGQVRGALRVTLDAQGAVQAELLPIAPLHPMRRLRGTFAELMSGGASEDYLQITITDEDDVPDAAARLRRVYSNLLQVLLDNARTRAAAADFSREALARRAPLALFEELFEKQNGMPMSDEQRQCAANLLETIFEEQP